MAIENRIVRAPMDDSPKQISFANFAGDFSPTAANDLRVGADLETELVFENLADAALIQSAKCDLADTYSRWVPSYACVACVEMQVAVADPGSNVDFYWNASGIVTAATGNMGDTSGSSGAYTPYSGDAADIAAALGQLIFIGSLVMSDEAVDSIQVGFVGILRPPHRWGSLIVANNAGNTICDTDDIEAHVVLNPILDEMDAS